MFKLFSTKALSEVTFGVDYDGKPTGATITVAGPEHERTRAAMAAFDKERRQYRKINPGRELVDDSEASRAATLQLLSARTLSWTGMADDDGQALPCTEENVLKAYSEVSWLRALVARKVGDEELFMPSSALPSSSTPALPSA